MSRYINISGRNVARIFFSFYFAGENDPHKCFMKKIMCERKREFFYIFEMMSLNTWP